MSIETVYDCECFPNLFSCVVVPLDPYDNTSWCYEISRRRNDAATFVYALRSGYWRRMYGFNNLNYDSPLIHKLIEIVDAGHTDWAYITATLKAFSNGIIDSDDRWSHRVSYKNEVVQQADIFLIHHFDNVNRSTSLKALEVAMRSRNVQDLPFHHTTVLADHQIPVVLDYNRNDTSETKRFVNMSRNAIAFRDSLGPKHLNSNDTKIGKSFFISELEKRSPGSCYTKDRKPRQTWRTAVHLADAILPWIRFERPEANAVLERLKATSLRPDEIKLSESRGGDVKVETKGVFSNLTATIDGFKFVFGTGGLHGSVTKRVIRADATHEIADIDVEAYYPSIAIVNGFYPEHLGPGFVEVYRDLKNDRVMAKAIGDMVKSDALKLANNGVYGDSNNQYGPFYDPLYTMKVTINGQLMLVLLGENLLKIPGLEIIQANTDGMTVRFPRSQRAAFDAVCKWWQWGTGMKLEEAQYDAMWIRDVNAYIARYSQDDINKKMKGKLKRKGAYDFELKIGDQKAWWRDHSQLIVPKAACAALVDDLDPCDYIRNHPDPWDFLIREKAKGSAQLVLRDGTPCQQTTRYYVAHDGQQMFKIMPPLAKAKDPTKDRVMAVFAEGQAYLYGERGNYRCSICGDHGPTFKFKKDFEAHNSDLHTFKVKVCNVFDGGDLPGLNIDYYLKETQKLLLE